MALEVLGVPRAAVFSEAELYETASEQKVPLGPFIDCVGLLSFDDIEEIELRFIVLSYVINLIFLSTF